MRCRTASSEPSSCTRTASSTRSSRGSSCATGWLRCSPTCDRPTYRPTTRAPSTAGRCVRSRSSTRSPKATASRAKRSRSVADALAETLPVDGDTLREAVWARVQTARNLRRPHTLELLGMIASDVIELHGDRYFGDDPAIVAGFARISDRPIVFIGHQKGGEVDENILRNFGMPHPEGYRKAIRMF